MLKVRFAYLTLLGFALLLAEGNMSGVLPSRSDLLIESVLISPEFPNLDEDMSIQLRVKNAGTDDINETIKIELHAEKPCLVAPPLSLFEAFADEPNEDAVCNMAPEETKIKGGLGKGKSSVINLLMPASFYAASTAFEIMIDPQDQIAEKDESNNAYLVDIRHSPLFAEQTPYVSMILFEGYLNQALLHFGFDVLNIESNTPEMISGYGTYAVIAEYELQVKNVELGLEEVLVGQGVFTAWIFSNRIIITYSIDLENEESSVEIPIIIKLVDNGTEDLLTETVNASIQIGDEVRDVFTKNVSIPYGVEDNTAKMVGSIANLEGLENVAAVSFPVEPATASSSSTWIAGIIDSGDSSEEFLTNVNISEGENATSNAAFEKTLLTLGDVEFILESSESNTSTNPDGSPVRTSVYAFANPDYGTLRITRIVEASVEGEQLTQKMRLSIAHNGEILFDRQFMYSLGNIGQATPLSKAASQSGGDSYNSYTQEDPHDHAYPGVGSNIYLQSGGAGPEPFSFSQYVPPELGFLVSCPAFEAYPIFGSLSSVAVGCLLGGSCFLPILKEVIKQVALASPTTDDPLAASSIAGLVTSGIEATSLSSTYATTAIVNTACNIGSSGGILVREGILKTIDEFKDSCGNCQRDIAGPDPLLERRQDENKSRFIDYLSNRNLQFPTVDAKLANNTLRLKAWETASGCNVGDAVAINYEVNQPAYIYIYGLNSRGVTHLEGPLQANPAQSSLSTQVPYTFKRVVDEVPSSIEVVNLAYDKSGIALVWCAPGNPACYWSIRVVASPVSTSPDNIENVPRKEVLATHAC